MGLDKQKKVNAPRGRTETIGPWKSGLAGKEGEFQDKKTIEGIANSPAMKKKRFKDSLRQPYDSKGSPETKRITNRMMGGDN
ncbi:MAG: hypothetical protein Q8R25_02190 [bacterium]|nr:hypothetical protein [bacterium]